MIASTDLSSATLFVEIIKDTVMTYSRKRLVTAFMTLATMFAPLGSAFALSINITDPNGNTPSIGAGSRINVDGHLVDYRSNGNPPVYYSNAIKLYLYWYQIPPNTDPNNPLGTGRVQQDATRIGLGGTSGTTLVWAGSLNANSNGGAISNYQVEADAYLDTTYTGQFASVGVTIK